MLDPEFIRQKYIAFVQRNPEYRELILPNSLPFEHFKVYQRWKPDRVRVLFIAESPPWNESLYFYNENSQGGLSDAIFERLGILGNSKNEKLQEFKNRNFLLTDTIKCIFKKNVRKSIPKKLIRFSAQEILEAEIRGLSPEFIFALGATALTALKHIQRFTQILSVYDSVVNACGKSTKVGKTTILLSVFPNNRNKRYEQSIESAFKGIRNA